MRTASLPMLFALAILAVGCGGGGAAAPAPAGPGAPGGCEVTTIGPLVGQTYQLAPAPLAQGGPIHDGTYDLVQVVVHGKATGPWSTDQTPAVRLAMKLTTDDRAAGAQGPVVVSTNLPPVFECTKGRFATIGNQLRTHGAGNGKIEAVGYTTGPDTLTLFQKETLTYVFRRRP